MNNANKHQQQPPTQVSAMGQAIAAICACILCLAIACLLALWVHSPCSSTPFSTPCISGSNNIPLQNVSNPTASKAKAPTACSKDKAPIAYSNAKVWSSEVERMPKQENNPLLSAQ